MGGVLSISGGSTVLYIILLSLKFIIGSILIFLCFILTIIHVHYHTQKQRKIQIEPRIKLSHNITYRCKKVTASIF